MGTQWPLNTPIHCSIYRYVLTQTDYFTKYVEAFPMPEKSALCVAKGLYKSFCRHGAPVHIICDQGREFVNQVMQINTYIKGLLMLT